MKTWFSRHACVRVSGRLNMTIEEVAVILDEGLAVPVGKEGTTEKVHKLFYSEIDSCCFVAVQDEENGEVITILPPVYHNRWKISPDALNQARALVMKEVVPRFIPATKPTIIQLPWFRFSALLEDGEGTKRLVKLSSIPHDEYPNIQVSLYDENIQQRLWHSLRAR